MTSAVLKIMLRTYFFKENHYIFGEIIKIRVFQHAEKNFQVQLLKVIFEHVPLIFATQAFDMLK